MNKVLLKSMYRRRMSCPQVVQQLWDAIKVIRCQHQVPTLEKIAKYMSRVHSVNEAEVSRQLQYCVRDELLLIRKSKGSKGSKVEQEGYKIPDFENDQKDESHDWYCFECHLGGDVISCQACHRVYHVSCLNDTLDDKETFMCTICQSCDEEDDSSLANIKLRKLNRLLTMVSTILKDRYSSLVNSNEFLRRSIFIGSPGAQVDIGGAKESWRIRYLVYKPIDLATMMASSKSQKYKNVSTFLAHAQSIVHSVVIFHGVLSDLADKSRQMLRECLSEIAQIKSCHSCYETAVLRQNRHWFCKPCRPPHSLVFAGSPYMPAKVLNEKDGKLEVVFFGSQHPRSIVERDSTLPISTPVGHLGKTSSTWSKAMDELARHQKMLSSNYQSSDSDDSSMDEIEPKAKKRLVKEETPVKSMVLLKKGRYSSDEEEVKKEEESKKDVVVKKRRGRPPKNSLSPIQASFPPTSVSTEPKRKPGRPKRKKIIEEDSEDILPCAKELVNETKTEEKLNITQEEIQRPESPSTTEPPPATTSKKNEEEIVSSSCMEPQVRSVTTQTLKKDKDNKEIIAKLKEELDEVRAIQCEEIKTLKETHSLEIAAAKKKQWCYNCEQEAIYHCCWNTAYCSTECQQLHWQREHKRVCRRKR